MKNSTGVDNALEWKTICSAFVMSTVTPILAMVVTMMTIILYVNGMTMNVIAKSTACFANTSITTTANNTDKTTVTIM